MTEEIVITGKFDIRGAINTNNFKKPITYCKILIDYPSIVRVDSMSSLKEVRETGEERK